MICHGSPDFIIAGAMKSGSTTLFRRLECHPQVAHQPVKEPNYFLFDNPSKAQERRYAALFAPSPGQIVGEASVSYALPANAARVAPRIRAGADAARLIFILRDPASRARSHYRHEVLRGRERRPFLTAIRDEGSQYLGASAYDQCLTPFLETFGRARVFVATTRELLEGDNPAQWHGLLDYLGLERVAAPLFSENESRDKRPLSRLGSMAWERGLLQRAPKAVPRALRVFARRAVFTSDVGRQRLIESSQAAMPPDLSEFFGASLSRLETAIDRPLDLGAV